MSIFTNISLGSYTLNVFLTLWTLRPSIFFILLNIVINIILRVSCIVLVLLSTKVENFFLSYFSIWLKGCALTEWEIGVQWTRHDESCQSHTKVYLLFPSRRKWKRLINSCYFLLFLLFLVPPLINTDSTALSSIYCVSRFYYCSTPENHTKV